MDTFGSGSVRVCLSPVRRPESAKIYGPTSAELVFCSFYFLVVVFFSLPVDSHEEWAPRIADNCGGLVGLILGDDKIGNRLEGAF